MNDNKLCSRCKIKKPKSDFGIQYSTADGLKGWCKMCFRKYQKIYRKEAHK